MIVRARAPLRLGLAGGGTDISPYSDIFGGAVLNATIDRYAYAVIRPLTGSDIRFVATDLNIDEIMAIADIDQVSCKLKLHQAVYLRVMRDFNAGEFLPMEISTFCEIPPGSGLGSSSTLVVAMIKGFVEYMNLPLDDYSIARLAYEVERIDCGFGGGKQDQYSAAFGGFNYIEFYENERVIVSPLSIKNWIKCELESSFVLFYTGISRESAQIILDQSKTVFGDNKEALEAMHEIKKEAFSMKEAILRGDFLNLAESLRRGWESKKRSANTISNQHINSIYDTAILNGAVAGKVSGAGGGGFMLFMVPPENRINVISALKKFEGQVSNCHFTNEGCQAWKII